RWVRCADATAIAGLTAVLAPLPIVGVSKVRPLVDLAERAPIPVALDSEEVAGGISRAAKEAGVAIGVLVEADTGMGRCGVAPGGALVALCRRVADLPALEVRGILTYQGFRAGPELEPPP